MSIPVPDAFPAGCEFFSSFGGDEFVRIPDAGWFRLDESRVVLVKLPGAPVSNGHSGSEAAFLGWVAEARRAAGAKEKASA